jgi:hypothetical protein
VLDGDIQTYDAHEDVSVFHPSELKIEVKDVNQDHFNDLLFVGEKLMLGKYSEDSVWFDVENGKAFTVEHPAMRIPVKYEFLFDRQSGHFIENKDPSTSRSQQMIIQDTIRRIIVDDYPVKNKMLEDKSRSNSGRMIKSGETYSYDQVWFGNDSLKQTLVFELYTDYHRLLTYHFFNNEIPTDLINSMALGTADGNSLTEKQKLTDINGFFRQAKKINSSYFTSRKGFNLGDEKQKAVDIYGKPDKQSFHKGIEKLEWEFIGDVFYDGKSDLKGKPLAKGSFGHQVVMYFKDGLLVGQILHNDIP